MSAYVLGPDADLDLNDIWEYIAVDSVDTADRWVDKLFNAFEALARELPAWGTGVKTSPSIRFYSGPLALT